MSTYSRMSLHRRAQSHANHQNMNQFGKTARHVIAKDHKPNIRASRIDDITAWLAAVRVDAITEAKSSSLSEVMVLNASKRRTRIIGGETISNKKAWMIRRDLWTKKKPNEKTRQALWLIKKPEKSRVRTISLTLTPACTIMIYALKLILLSFELLACCANFCACSRIRLELANWKLSG